MGGFRTRAQRLIALSLTTSLALSGTAYARVTIDDTDLAEGENSVGGGTATYGNNLLDMVGVTAGQLVTDESLTINFNGDNDIDHAQVKGDANVTMNFDGDNEVEDIEAYDNSNVTVNMDDDNDFEDIEAHDNASLTVNVTGETECEAIKGYDDASVTVKGTTCPQKDVIEVGEDEADERIGTERGDLIIKDVTIVMDSEMAEVVSRSGDVKIMCSKISGNDDNEQTEIRAGGKLFIGGSVIDITGTISADGMLTIRRSDVDAEKPDDEDSPYRIWSKTGIELIEEKNGEVKEGELDGVKVYYVDTDDGDEVHLKSALTPCYYRSCDDDEKELPSTGGTKALPKTDDTSGITYVLSLLAAGFACVASGLTLRPRVRQGAHAKR